MPANVLTSGLSAYIKSFNIAVASCSNATLDKGSAFWAAPITRVVGLSKANALPGKVGAKPDLPLTRLSRATIYPFRMPRTIELPAQKTQAARNVRRWQELLEDKQLARLPYAIETDRLGRIIMSPPPASDHTDRVSKILHALYSLMHTGRILAETAVSTSDGVKVTDAAWLSIERVKELQSGPCLLQAPEICIEVVSRSNTVEEMSEKRSLYLEAGAKEVWVCALDGSIEFFIGPHEQLYSKSELCPEFPSKV